MMVFAGQSYALGIEYIVDGEYVVPSAATLSLRGLDGTLLITDDPLDVSKTHVTYEIDASHNVLGTGNTLEHRFVTVSLTHEGQEHHIPLVYRIEEFVPLVATPADVRSELGLDVSELADQEIDIHEAYHQLKDEYGLPFINALTAGSSDSLYANRAVSVRAALNVCSSLTFRAGTKFSSEESRFERQGGFDVDQVAARLASKLAALLEKLTGEDVTTIEHFLLATPTDAITGE